MDHAFGNQPFHVRGKMDSIYRAYFNTLKFDFSAFDYTGGLVEANRHLHAVFIYCQFITFKKGERLTILHFFTLAGSEKRYTSS